MKNGGWEGEEESELMCSQVFRSMIAQSLTQICTPPQSIFFYIFLRFSEQNMNDFKFLKITKYG